MEIRRLGRDEADACELILRELPEWFGIERFIRQYRQDLASMETYVAEVNKTAGIAGFITINRHDERRAEIQVMAVRQELHRQGIGRALIARARSELRSGGIESLTLKTIGPSHPSPWYEATRDFYRAMGFRAIEETTEVWGEQAPCLIMGTEL